MFFSIILLKRIYNVTIFELEMNISSIDTGFCKWTFLWSDDEINKIFNVYIEISIFYFR